MQDLREQDEAFGVAGDSAENAFGAAQQPAAEEDLHDQDHQQRCVLLEVEPVTDRGDKSGGERNRYGAHGATRQCARAFGPADQRFGIEARAEILAGQRDVFMQVDFGAQFNNERLPLENLRQPRRREQPLRKATFAHRKSRGGQQLEEAPAPEEIEIFGIDVVFVAEAIAGLPGTEPAIVDASDSFFVVGGGGLRAMMSAENLFMDGGKDQIESDGNKEPDW